MLSSFYWLKAIGRDVLIGNCLLFWINLDFSLLLYLSCLQSTGSKLSENVWCIASTTEYGMYYKPNVCIIFENLPWFSCVGKILLPVLLDLESLPDRTRCPYLERNVASNVILLVYQCVLLQIEHLLFATLILYECTYQRCNFTIEKKASIKNEYKKPTT